MAKKKSKGAKLGAAIKAKASGGITKQEFNNIAKQFKVDAADVVQKMDKINKNTKAKGETPYLSLNSGAANMLIKQASKVSSPFSQPSFGTGRIGKTLQGMMGTPASSGRYYKGQRVGATAGTPSTLMIGGTQIRPGGLVANLGFGSSPRATGIPASAPTDPTDTDQYLEDRRAQAAAVREERRQDTGLDFGAVEEAMGGLDSSGYTPEMVDYSGMFDGMFDQISSDYDMPNPLQLAAIGKAYGADMIRARQRQRKTRSDYLRNRMNNMMIGGTSAGLGPMMIGGGLTL